MDPNYGGVIWTNHILERLKERGIKQGDAWATWSSPQNSRFSESRGGWVYERTWGDQKVEVVAKKNEKGKWVILSAWSKPLKKKLQRQNNSLFEQVISKVFGFLDRARS